MSPGRTDLPRRVARLTSHLPAPLEPLARLAYNYRWSWAPNGPSVFRDIDAYRWERSNTNPVRLLLEADTEALERAATDADLLERIDAVVALCAAEAPAGDLEQRPERPVAFFCAEFAVHASLPVYSGGLGVLAGDILKEASDRALPFVGIGMLYSNGYFHQRLDLSGWQMEYWTENDADLLPLVRCVGADGRSLKVTVPVRGRDVIARVWCARVGRVPLLLLDTAVPENAPVDRWITARLYERNPEIRLAQYLVLGVGGLRALEQLEIEPSVLHLNEGHAASAALQLAAEHVALGASLPDALAAVRERIVFTTHTPVAAGNETYEGDQVLHAVPALPAQLGVDAAGLLGLGRVHPEDPHEPFGMTQLAIRASRAVNAVSRRHGEVAREMWQPMFPGTSIDDVPIRYVTNGVHVPSWLAPPMRALLDRHFGDGWPVRAADPSTWSAVDGITDEELWEARAACRRRLVEMVRRRSVADRLRRGETLEYVESAAETFDPEVLTVGFARRIAGYKRLHLLTHNPQRALALLDGHRRVQFVFGGKAHPRDDDAKRILQGVFSLKSSPLVSAKVAFLEDYDLSFAQTFIAGCDVWVNLPRPPFEASGTSGMKAAMNGALNLSVLDGWWAEAYDGTNGWAIDSSLDGDEGAQDARDATAFYELFEQQIVPCFSDRDDRGIPVGWLAQIRSAMRSIGPQFCAARMLEQYERDIYRFT
jgi:glycogen phosphorylase